MESFFFGRSMHLFGFFHPCVAASARGGIIIAPPMLKEAIRSHFALREIAIGLSRSGYDVLRFDFSGCGDSFGELTAMRLEDWVEDLKDAVHELRELAGSTRLSVFSVRFSCCVAAVVSSAVRWDTMVMWDPLLHGSDWLERIESVGGGKKGRRLVVPHEYLGEQTSEAFTESVAACRIGDIAAQKIVSIVTDEHVVADPSWDCRRLASQSRWDDFYLENVFAHQVIEETIRILTHE